MRPYGRHPLWRVSTISVVIHALAPLSLWGRGWGWVLCPAWMKEPGMVLVNDALREDAQQTVRGDCEHEPIERSVRRQVHQRPDDRQDHAYRARDHALGQQHSDAHDQHWPNIKQLAHPSN